MLLDFLNPAGVKSAKNGDIPTFLGKNEVNLQVTTKNDLSSISPLKRELFISSLTWRLLKQKRKRASWGLFSFYLLKNEVCARFQDLRSECYASILVLWNNFVAKFKSRLGPYKKDITAKIKKKLKLMFFVYKGQRDLSDNFSSKEI